jgi:hypothetical protein
MSCGYDGDEMEWHLATQVIDAVLPLIEADVRESIATEIEAMQPNVPEDPRTETVDAALWLKARATAARIARGADR